MSWAAKYKVEARRFQTGEVWTCFIEQENYSGAVNILKGGASPFTLKYIDNNETKFPSIAASFLNINIISDTFDIEEVVQSDDKTMRISLYQGDVLQWRGFISTDDCTENYISGNREFNLTATDGLGFLKEESYKYRTGETGVDAYGKRLVLDCIADCLHYTFTELPIQVQCNIYEENMTILGYRNPLDQCKVHTKLFLYTVEGPTNMYDALDVMLQTFKCTLFQQYGEWHIVRRGDYLETSAAQSYLYSWPDLTPTQVTRRWDIYRNIDFTPINASHLRLFIKPTSESKITHNYIIGELPANPKFSRGALYAENAGVKRYEVDLWEWFERQGLNDPDGVGSNDTSQLRRTELYDANDNLEESFAEWLPYPSVSPGAPAYALRPEPIPIEAGDSISISYDTKCSTTFNSGDTEQGPHMFLIIDDVAGTTRYRYDSVNRLWKSTVGTDGYATYIITELPNYPDQTDWQTLSVETAPFPVKGTLYIMFNPWVKRASNWIRIKNFNATLSAQLQGRDQGVIGEESTTTATFTSRKTVDETIRLGDVPKRVYASALWRGDDDTLLTNNWCRLANITTFTRLININSADIQKSLWRIYQQIDGDFLGVTFDSNTKLIGPGNFLTYDTPLVIRHLPTNISIDIANNTFSGSFQEFYDTRPDGKDEGQTRINATNFKYLFDERS